jgi:hypothetical protein
MFMPWMFMWSVFHGVVTYFAFFLSLRFCHRPPPKPFAAARATEFFLWVLFFALCVCIAPLALFLSATANPKCGPFRDPTCAPISTACNADVDYRTTTCGISRANLDGFDSLFQDKYITTNASLSTSEKIDECDGRVACWIQIGLEAVFSAPALAVTALILALLLYFTRVRLKRVTALLRVTTRELDEEHHDKILLIRNMGIALD